MRSNKSSTASRAGADTAAYIQVAILKRGLAEARHTHFQQATGAKATTASPSCETLPDPATHPPPSTSNQSRSGMLVGALEGIDDLVRTSRRPLSPGPLMQCTLPNSSPLLPAGNFSSSTSSSFAPSASLSSPYCCERRHLHHFRLRERVRACVCLCVSYPHLTRCLGECRHLFNPLSLVSSPRRRPTGPACRPPTSVALRNRNYNTDGL